MSDCIRDESQRYLAGNLNGAEESAFIDHLDTCPRCQQQLEAEVGDIEAWNMARDLKISWCATESGTHSTTRLQQKSCLPFPPLDNNEEARVALANKPWMHEGIWNTVITERVLSSCLRDLQ